MKHWFLLFILCLSTYLHGQSISWGSSYKLPKNAFHQKILKVNKDGSFYVLKKYYSYLSKNQGDLAIELYSDKGEFVKNNNVKLPEGKHDFYLEKVSIIDDDLILYLSYSEGTKSTLMKAITSMNGVGSYQMFPLLTVNASLNRNTFKEIGDESSLSFYSPTSVDGKHVLYHVQSKGSIDTIKLPFKKRSFELDQVLKSSKGLLYLSGRQYYPKDSLGINYQYKFMYYSSDSLMIRNDQFTGIFHSSLKMRLNEVRNELIIASYFSSKSEFRLKGVSLQKFSLDSLIRLFANKSTFSDSTLIKMQSALIKRKPDDLAYTPELMGIEIDHMQLRSDGGIVLLSEHYREYQTSYKEVDGMGNMSIIANDHYEYLDLLITNISSDGTIEWAKPIHKIQSTINDGGKYSSYFHCFTRDGIHLYFNENGKNVESTENYIPLNNGKKAVLFHLKIDQSGNASERTLVEGESNRIRTVLSTQINRDKILIYCERKGKYRYGTIQF